ncbi:alkyl hydroperoxide reductase Thiol specific antioxidant Mal allergen [Seminavis robusta]|uniref:thioredoxin-dependent peroxiredoxin n=1 Tax=Seminavis robusta TaxID=568900 RepID=A0A9N8E9L0_9STRA|nr:alkyl hydroperoxide reductase Thiol specific antioxidant Mal allergen [Seminavis robusta]|eukprot:Sro846_g210210.1 alkyl hydroperoxide reductase Thiol specific antioxidant Mal allergen (236) ;mRNA; r:37068-37887
MEHISKKVPKDILDVFTKKIHQHAEEHILDKALKTGDVATDLDFDLLDAHGNHVKSSELLAKGPIVVTFVRGSWCAFCNMQVHALQNVINDIQSKNATLVVISPQSTQSSMKMVEQGAMFPLLTDVDSKLAKQFNVHYQVDPELHDAFLNVGIDLAQVNQDGLLSLPVPATFVISQEKKILYSFLDVNYRHRAEPADILNALPEPVTRTGRRRVYRKRVKQITMLKLDWGDGAAT